ncbi:DUF389 domain-containing protein [Nannocystis pusilla]|uniref:DUF389 domain-containing protein n=1 Tax=Nannocystis pusilla TaxID=889268 RepID=A0A9X3J004_9BACT|nr:DUF389 domain-containing protein [Nannocystis pusilla]MCY1009580.1 DUF389 domain-containing protein [Nannocystis pusilla]
MSDGAAPAQETRREHPLQDTLARWLGVPTARRAEIVRDMYSRHRSDAVSYWLQLVLATGIATLGLVLSSTGVVIGAMLISPLMSPIVGLGMGLAVGSPLLTLRSMFRVAASIVWVVALAAALTVGLPFHETTTEIAARTSPTVLDLAVAAFCAMAAGFTTARQSADTTSAAAGTAIGISLVPPLCVAGYGLGVSQWNIAGGALLLFTANFCAIIFCSALLFIGLGFNHVVLAEDGASGVGTRLRGIFGARYGVMWRLVLPALLLASVYVPLRAALGEVAWKIRVRDAVTRILAEVAPDDRSFRTALAVESSGVSVRLALIGSPEEAHAVETLLRSRIAAVAGLDPEVDVTAVADERSLQKIAASLVTPPPAAPPPPPPRPSSLREPIEEALVAHWPEVGGALRGWQMGFDAERPVLHVRHQGPSLGGAAEALLADFVGLALGESVAVRTEPVLTGRWTSEALPPREFLGALARGLALGRDASDTHACVERPATSAGAAENDEPSRAAGTELARTADLLLEAFAGPGVEVREGTAWAIELVVGPCPPTPEVAGDTNRGVDVAGAAPPRPPRATEHLSGRRCRRARSRVARPVRRGPAA